MNKKMWGRVLLGLLILFFQSTGVFAWDSVRGANEMDTHKLIVAQAVTILQNDLAAGETSDFLSNLDILNDNLYDLKRGAVWPDFNPDGYLLYQDHFYDPDTGMNFTNGYIPDTAESQTRLFTAMAIEKWKNADYSGAAFDLGTAMHYFADLNEPHHASNRTGGEGTAHTEFEQWVGSVKYDYVYDNSGNGTDSAYYTGSVSDYNYITDYLAAEAYMCASNAKGLADQAKMTSSWADWEYVAEETMSEAQESIARILYRFIHEVTTPTTHSPADPIGKFHVVFKVADEYEAGTDDSVYFGMQLNDGRTVQFECDLPGNDFSQDLLWGYEFDIPDGSFTAADVTKVWIKKTDATWLGDDLKLEYMNVYMKGRAVLTQSINQWLGKGGWWNNDVYYNMDVNGLDY